MRGGGWNGFFGGSSEWKFVLTIAGVIFLIWHFAIWMLGYE